MLDAELRLGHVDAALVEQQRDLALLGGEFLRALVLERAHRDHRQARVDLHRGDRVARPRAEEGLLELGMGDALGCAGEAGAELHADRAHFEVAGDRLAAADPAGDEHQVLVGQRRQELLRQHRGRHRADVAAGLHPLDDQRVAARAQQLLRQRQCRGEHDDLRAERLDRLDAALGRDSAGEHDMADAVLAADLDQLEQHRVHGDQVDAERLAGERLRAGDLGVEQFGRHRPAGDHAEPAGVADRGDEIAFGHPAHRSAEDRELGTEEFAAPLHQVAGLGIITHGRRL